MRDNELYRRILGIESPWVVADVELDAKGGEVRVFIENSGGQLPCPECGSNCSRYDSRPRRWRHLDTCQYRTILVAQVPRIDCPDHGRLQVRVPWGEPGSRFTALFEAVVIDWLKEASIAAVSRQLRLSWKAVDGIMSRAVQRGLHRRPRQLPRRLGVDETAFQRRHEYVTVLTDQQRGTVVHVADGREGACVGEFLGMFSREELATVESVAMDMWQPFIQAVLTHVPEARDKISFDKFHVAKHLGDAVDRVRRAENKGLIDQESGALKGTKYLWLQRDLAGDQRQRLDLLKATALKTARAWAIKELAMTLWRYRYRAWARKAWLEWYAWAIRSKLDPVKRVARMVKRHLYGIVNAIVLGVTNARAEGINSRIQWLKYTARGFRNRDRFRNAIYFHLGGLDLYPALPSATHTK